MAKFHHFGTRYPEYSSEKVGSPAPHVLAAMQQWLRRMDFPKDWRIGAWECNCKEPGNLARNNGHANRRTVEIAFHSDRLKGEERDRTVVHELLHTLTMDVRRFYDDCSDLIQDEGVRRHLANCFLQKEEALVLNLENSVVGVWKAGIEEGKRRVRKRN